MTRVFAWTLMAGFFFGGVAAAQSDRGEPPTRDYGSLQPGSTGPYGQPLPRPYVPPDGRQLDRYPSTAPRTPAYPSLPSQPGHPGGQRNSGPRGYPTQPAPRVPGFSPAGPPPRSGYQRQPPAATPGSRPAPPPPANAPFTLTAQEQAYLDRVLQAWEQSSAQVDRYRAKFVRWKYDDTFHRDKPLRDEGHVRYIAPDRGLYEVNPDNGRPEKWISDGKTIYQFDFNQKLLIEYPLPPELQGQAITHGPLPFLFSAKAETLKKRYFMRVITPQNVQGQVWLEAFPRYQVDAAEFQKAQIIINTRDMRPKAVRLYLPGGNERTVHEFYDVVVNDPLHFLQGDIGRPGTPTGWRREERNQASGQAARPAPPAPRR